MATLIKILGSEIFFCFGRTPGDSSRHWRDNTNEHFKFEIARDKEHGSRNPLGALKENEMFFAIGLNEISAAAAALISAKVKQSQWRAVPFIWTVTRRGADCR